jgi:hypothetical protein
VTELWQSPTKPWNQCSAKRQEALYTAWSSGNLSWKLDPVQKAVYDAIRASHATVQSSLERLYCIEFGRRGGKDFVCSLIAIEQAMRATRYSRIPYAAPTQEACKKIVAPTMLDIFLDCPPELLPYEIKKNTFRRSADELNWDGAASIQLVGVDMYPDRLRGTSMRCGFVTEAGFIGDLENIMQSVLLPQLMTEPDGFMVLNSTPPVTPGHYWSTTMLERAKLRNMHAKRTIYDFAFRFGQRQVDGLITEMGGVKATKFLREGMCEHVLETENAVVPEFREAKVATVTEEPFKNLPLYRDTYVSLDPGFSHASGGLFGYMDFEKATFNIEGCFRVQGLNSSEIARRIKAREWQLWGRVPAKPDKLTAEAWKDELEQIRSHFYPDLPVSQPVQTWSNNQPFTKTYRRVSDTDSKLIADLACEHGLIFAPTEKTDLELNINAMRLNVQRLRFRIHPRCVELITDLEQATWNKARTKMETGAGGHHYDTISALNYLNRALLWNRNPFPPQSWDRTNHHVPKFVSTTATRSALSSLFGRKRGK